jgi:N-acetylneuraminate lyase
MKITRLEGLIAASFTPYRQGRIHPELIPAYASALVREGLAGVFINGTTGESLSLSTEERKELAETWLRSAPANLPVLVHVGHNSLPCARKLAAHAAEHGARAVSAMAPTFFRPDLAGLVDYLAEIASAAAGLPFYYYHMPSMTGARFPMEEFLKAAAVKIPNLMGVKYTWEDLEDYERAVRWKGGRFDVVFGRDEILLDGLGKGARAAIGSTYNAAAPLYLAVWRAWQEGRMAEARGYQLQAKEMIEACRRTGWSDLPAIRALASHRLGIELGPPRAPLFSPPEKAMAEILRMVKAFADLSPGGG